MRVTAHGSLPASGYSYAEARQKVPEIVCNFALRGDSDEAKVAGAREAQA